MSLIYKKFVEEKLDNNGNLLNIKFNPPQNFNFAYDVLDVLGDKIPDKKAMVWVSIDHKHKSFTFKDMKIYSSKTANYFKSLGIVKGDKVMLILKRNYQFWFAVNALHKIGAVVVPATHLLTKKDLVYRFNSAGIKAVVCTNDDTILCSVEEALPESPTVKILSVTEGFRKNWSCFNEGVESAEDTFLRPDDCNTNDDIMIMYFTSGTTGYPKIVCHNYTYPLGHIVTAKYWQNVISDGLHLTIADTGWAKAVWGKLYGQWLCEACIFTFDYEKFNAAEILTLLQDYGVTTFCAPPTIYRFFIKEDLSKFNLKKLKYAVIAGEALNPEVYNQFYKHTGIKLMEGFGQTETTITVANLTGMEPKPGSMGKPNPQYHVDLIDAEGNSTNAGEVGEIVIQTDYLPCGFFMGYYEDKEKTDSVWNGGVYHTGDTAWKDEDGYYWYVGRTDDLIKSSGYRIGPFEIESVIMEHPSVLECAVTGVPDEIRGYAVKATILLAKGYSPSEELKKEIQDFVKHLTAPYKYPRVVEFVDELPKTISGKIRRVEIREKH
ncbi:MAG: AMP-binding protein [Clostridia bacterium]|nr:AMP-binding protein [Clostridia bacterium]